MDAEQAAGLLGIEVYTLAWSLRYEAADELERVANRIRVDENASLDVGKARRLLRASHAAYKAGDEVTKALEEDLT
jgi:hypothetical protein